METLRLPPCSCLTLEQSELFRVLDQWAGQTGFALEQLRERPHLFADLSLFVPLKTLQAMQSVVDAVEQVSSAPGFIAAVKSRSPSGGALEVKGRGVFMGYDFHLDEAGTPRLIEVNTNAGGAYLAAAGALAHRRCCGGPAPADFRASVIAMFLEEWRLQRGDALLRRVAIVDTAPRSQYLYPEFLIAQRVFADNDIEALIVDPSELRYDSGRLLATGLPIDLVYNRLTDFSLEASKHQALLDAYVAGHVVVTPGPGHHARYADKRNLALLTDPAQYATWGLSASVQSALKTIPRTQLLTEVNAAAVYARRRDLFFKPVAGHAGKGVYRGSKITRSVWSRILEGDYVAQELVPPREQTVAVDGQAAVRKTDLRLYTYGARPLLYAGRVYQGQTTNFRTPGGGFAPLLVAGDCSCT